jgi:hypothetical protein
MFKNILGGSSKKENTNQSRSKVALIFLIDSNKIHKFLKIFKKDSRSRQSNDSSSSSTTTSQGFMCPMCYESFPNPDVLQDHFNLTHNDTDSINSNSFNGQHNESFNSKASNMDDRNQKDNLSDEVNMWREQARLLDETRITCKIRKTYLKS